MSASEGQVLTDGDVFEMESKIFGLPLINPILFGIIKPNVIAKPLW